MATTFSDFGNTLEVPDDAIVKSKKDSMPPQKDTEVTNDLSQRKKLKRQSTRKKIKKQTVVVGRWLVVFVLSQVGMVSIVIGYSILGAFIFQALESPKEMQNRVKIKDLRDDINQKLWIETKKFNVLAKKNWTDAADEILQEFQSAIYEATKNLGWDGKTTEAEGTLEWSFEGALLYSVTVITTIGYGHIAPKTLLGRIATILYAFIGIPLTLMCLANLGMLMSKGFKIFYNKIPAFCAKLPCCRSKPLHRVQSRRRDGESGVREDNDVFEMNEYKPKSDNPPPKSVPILVCLLVLILYFLFGTILWDLWESSWDTMDAFYFCFITLSTIGFGDIVPGHNTYSGSSRSKQIICTLWLLFGLALLAMCFDLLQEQVRSIGRKFGRCMGLVKKDNPGET